MCAVAVVVAGASATLIAEPNNPLLHGTALTRCAWLLVGADDDLTEMGVTNRMFRMHMRTLIVAASKS